MANMWHLVWQMAQYRFEIRFFTFNQLKEIINLIGIICRLVMKKGKLKDLAEAIVQSMELQ